jgi:fumarate reductase flavoprotein subunit
VAGGGMAGLVAAARCLELGGRPLVYEKGDRLGGSMLLSSGVIWRHADWDDFRRECPGGDPALQRLVWERLDEAIAWLCRLGAAVVTGTTGNPRTRGMRFDTRRLREALIAHLPPGGIVTQPAPLGRDEAYPTILATGGFGASPELVAQYIEPASPLRLRASPWSTGDGLTYGLLRGGALTGGMDEFYGRNMPAVSWGEADFVPLAQLYAKEARIFDEDGVEFFEPRAVSWSETNVVQATARRPNARCFYLLDRAAMGRRGAGRTVAEFLDALPAGALRSPGELPFAAPQGTVAAVRIEASITHTIGGLQVDERARVLGRDGGAITGLYASGVDVGGIATGGYASGLAQALVLGLQAAESAAAEA